MNTYELKLADGRIVTWQGTDGVNASERYVDCHREAAVVAWREDRTPQVRIGMGREECK